MIRVKLSSPLRAYAGNNAVVELEGRTVGECIELLERRYPGVSATLRDGDGGLASAINLYVNGEDVRYQQGLGTALSDGDTLTIVVAVAGG